MFSWRNRKESNAEVPRFYEEYLSLRPEQIRLDTPLEGVRFIVLDTETTGLRPRKDRILSVGAVTVQAGVLEVATAFHRFIEQRGWEIGLGRDIVIHGILPSRPDLESERAVLEDTLAYLGKAVLVGHHVRFDIKMLNHSLARFGAGALKNRSIDTANLYKAVHPLSAWAPEPNYGLDRLAREYRIPLHDRHTALGDAFITAQLFHKLLARLRKQGKMQLGDILRK